MDDAQQRSQTAKAVRQLKELAVEAIHLGLSYAEMEKQVGADIWSANAIKQFVHRPSSSRTNKKVKRLAKVVLDYLDHSDTENDHAVKRAYVRSIFDSKPVDILKFYDQKFRSSRTISAQLYFPKRYSFVRYNIQNMGFLVISVEIITVGEQSYFVMKLSGGGNKKRVVVGSVHSTVTNTHMVGLAFSISEFATAEDFETLSTRKLDDLHHLLSSNPIGVEELSFSNVAFKDTYFPVAFAGLDGGGVPVAGIGMLINEESIADFGILSSTLHAQSADTLPRVATALTQLGCRTQSVDTQQKHYS